MKIITDAGIRDMTEEEESGFKETAEYHKKHFDETARDHVEEFIDRIAEIDSITDIIKIAKDIKAKRGGNK